MNENRKGARVSVFARLVPALSFMIAIAGTAWGSLYFREVLWAMEEAGSGPGAVASGIAEANQFVVVALYLAIVCTFAGILVFVIRLFLTTNTVAPSAWFFVGSGVLVIFPPALLWTAESMLIGSLAGQSGVVNITLLLGSLSMLSMIAAPLSILLLLAGSVWPLYSQAKRGRRPLVALVSVELLLITVAVAFRVRTSWLYEVGSTGVM